MAAGIAVAGAAVCELQRCTNMMQLERAAQATILDERTNYAEFARQHVELWDTLTRLRTMATSPREGHPEAAVLAAHVDAAHQRLASHFAFEERGEYLRYATAARPSLKPVADILRTQHGEMLGELAAVCAGLQTGLALSDAATTILRILERLVDHELDERQLLQRSLVAGLGSARARGRSAAA